MDWWAFAQQLGPGAVIILGLAWTGYKQIWVFGWQYREVAKERDAWRQVALKGTEVAETFARIVQQGSQQ